MGRNKHKKNKKTKSQKDNEVDTPNEIDESIQDEENVLEVSHKRQHEEEDSDLEDKPRKKKKKKQTVVEESSEKKGKKSIRQMKKEKHAQRQAEAAALSKDQLKSQCISYLSQWKHDKQNWKFMKIKQVWLYKNMFKSNLVPDSSWPTLLEYFESAKGNIHNLLLEDANKIIKQMDDWTESQDKGDQQEDNNEETQELKKPDDTAYKRARDIIQCLQ